MKRISWAIAALTAAAVLTACGGGGAGSQATKVGFTGFVNFGDSLSDVGSYKVGAIAALGGGRYTINSADTKNWTDLVAKQYGLAAPCPAQTGLAGTLTGFNVPVKNDPNCFSYAQGGSRVTNPFGPGNINVPDGIGQLTVPIVTQISSHLTKSGGSFTGKELVTLMAGGNDLFMQAGVYAATATTISSMVARGSMTAATAQTQLQNAATAAVTGMGVAGGELGGYVKALIVGKGAKTVVVVNLPNVSKTPYGLAQSAEGQKFVDLLTTTFNDQLKTALAGVPGVILADAYTESTMQAANPAPYGLTNVVKPACDLTKVSSALVCSPATLIAGDTSRFQYADAVHPTPYGYELLAKFVLSEMLKAGLL